MNDFYNKELFLKLYKNSTSIKALLIELRNSNFTIGESVFALKNELQLSFAEANTLIVNSEAWKDQLEQNKITEQEFVNFFEKNEE